MYYLQFQYLYLLHFNCKIIFCQKKLPYVITISLIIFALFTYNIRNISRLDKEITFYKYNLIESPFFLLIKSTLKKIIDKNNYKIFSPENNNMCWVKPPVHIIETLALKIFSG